MPRSKSSIRKPQRHLALVEIIGRSGKMRKPEIDQAMSAYFDCEADEVFKHRLYVDLRELAENGQLSTKYFDSSGREIAEYDGRESAKTTVCEWSIPGAEESLPGQKLWEKSGGKLEFSSRLRRDISVTDEINLNENLPTLRTIFNWGTSPLTLRIEDSALPIKILIGRTVTGTDLSVGSIAPEFGQRLGICLLRLSSISGFKVGLRPGHALIEFLDRETIIIRDLGSTNGTAVTSLMPSDVTNRLRMLKDWQKSTRPKTDGDTEFRTPIKPRACIPGEAAKIKLPALIQLGPDLEILAL